MKMNFFKRLLAITVVGCTALSITSCSDTTWAYKSDNVTVESGLYILQTMTAYSKATSHQDIDEDEENLFKQTLDDKPAKDWIIDEAKNLSCQYIAIEQKFDELDLALTESDLNMVDQSAKTGWETVGPFFSKNGVSEETYRLTMTNTMKKELIFEKYYKPGGIQEIPAADIEKQYKDNYASVNIFGIKLEIPAEGEELTEEQIKTNEVAKKSADEMLALLNGGDKTFNEVYSEYKKIENEGKPEEEQKDTTVVDDDETKFLIKIDDTAPSVEVVKGVFEAKPDEKAVLIEDEAGYFLVQRYDIMDDKEKFEEMNSDLMLQLRSDDFDALLEAWVSEIEPDLTVNQASINRYTPKNIDFTM